MPKILYQTSFFWDFEFEAFLSTDLTLLSRRDVAAIVTIVDNLLQEFPPPNLVFPEGRKEKEVP